MALPSTGPISMSQINVELGRSATANISLDAAENGTYAPINQNSAIKPLSGNPASMSEWRGYDHTAGGGTTTTTPPTIYDVMLSESPFGDPGQACSEGSLIPSRPYYSMDRPALPQGATVYMDPALTAPFDGMGQWWYDPVNNVSYLIDSNGIVIEALPC